MRMFILFIYFFQNKRFKKVCSFWNVKSNVDPNKVNMLDVSTLIFVLVFVVRSW